MMKSIIASIFVLTSVMSFGQVGIGITTPNSSAVLDVDVSSITPKKGFLLPRVNLNSNADVTTISTPISGMTVFNGTTAGTGSSLITGKRVSVWDGTIWQVVSNLSEIISLKQPIDYVLASNSLQNFTTDNTLNAFNGSNPVLVTWQTGDVSVDNPQDISLSNSIINIKTAAFYQISGSVNFRGLLGAGQNSNVGLVLQTSTDGTTWTSFYSSRVPIDKGVAGMTQTIAIPQIIKQFNVNDKVRAILYKPSGSASFSNNSGIIVNETNDQTKSLRLTRILQ